MYRTPSQNMRKVIPLVFALSISAGQVLAWGEGTCPFKKQSTNQETSTEKAEKSDSSQND